MFDLLFVCNFKNDVILLLRNSLNVIFVYCSYFDEFYMCVYVFSEVVC